MSRLASLRGRKVLVPYLCVGDPNLEASVELALGLADAGADAVELGLPFSDPLADGPVIQAAGQRALAAGFRVADGFRAAARVREARPGLPLLFMTYYNVLFVAGVEAFVGRSAEAGVDGLIVADLPVEEAGPVESACRARGLDLVLFVAPTSTAERLAAVARHAGGFVYCVSLTGVTGAREGLSGRVPDLVARVRPLTDLPLLVGFGIGSPEAAAEAARLADGAIVGSALVRAHHEGGLPAAVALCRAMARAVHGV
jgi:tryptophan synthase alpha chain